MEREIAICRGCGQELRGKPYYMGGSAYHPKTGKRCRVNHYGGFVCSEECDYSASVKMLSSMPGCSNAIRPSCFAKKRIQDNWGDER